MTHLQQLLHKLQHVINCLQSWRLEMVEERDHHEEETGIGFIVEDVQDGNTMVSPIKSTTVNSQQQPKDGGLSVADMHPLDVNELSVRNSCGVDCRCFTL